MILIQAALKSYPLRVIWFYLRILYFYKSEAISAENDIFYITKNHASPYWNKPLAVKALGNNNSGLCAISYNDEIFVASRDHESKIKLISYKEGAFSDVIYYDLKVKSSGDLSLCIFFDKILLFFKDADENFIWHFLLGEKNNSYTNSGVVSYWLSSLSDRTAYTSVSPRTIVYKGLMYLMYATPDELAWHHISFDGRKWSYPVHFIKTNYSYPPALAIHRGLLKVAFVGSTDFRDDRISDRAIYQYSYNENSWSLPMPSSYILAGESINMVSYDDTLLAIYPKIGEFGITDDIVDSHNKL